MRNNFPPVIFVLAASALIALPALGQVPASDTLTVFRAVDDETPTAIVRLTEPETDEPGTGRFFSTATLNDLPGMNGNSFLGVDTAGTLPFTTSGALVLFEAGTVTPLQVFNFNELFLTIGSHGLQATLTANNIPISAISDIVGITEGLETIPGTGPGTGPVHSLGFVSDPDPTGTLPDLGLTGGGITFALENAIANGQENRFLSQAAAIAGYSLTVVSDTDAGPPPPPPPGVPDGGVSVGLLAIGIAALAFFYRKRIA